MQARRRSLLHQYVYSYIHLFVQKPADPAAGIAASSPVARCEFYRVLGEPVRLRLLALAAEEELAIGELAELLGESQPNVSRHAGPLKQVGLLAVRKQGTRNLLRAIIGEDAVAKDAVASGRALCLADGSLGRIAEVIRARDALTREYFEVARGGGGAAAPGELGAYLMALAPLLPQRHLAIDAGTGDGGLLEVLAPVFTRVLAVDRSAARLDEARARVQRRGYPNVSLLHGELDGPEVRGAAGGGADAVFAARLLHHAAKPAHLMSQLHELCAPGGALVVLDYAHHTDESMRDRADLWLGFTAAELIDLSTAAGFAPDSITVTRIPAALCGSGPDHHLPWQVLCARRPTSPPDSRADAASSRGAASKHQGKGKGASHG
jgi:ArsR family transcriptional regulator